MDYSEDIQRTARWGAYFAETWNGEVPTRLHSASIGNDGAPRWNPDFEKWLTRSERDQGEMFRTTKVMRRLRRAYIREYEVLYRVLLLREPVEETTRWLNERAERNGIPLPAGRSVHYRPKDTLALLISGVAWALHHW